MKKIITAIGDKKLNEKLRQENFQVIGKDIQYIEGVFEQLEIVNDINLIIISNKLIKDNRVKEIINKINLLNKKIKIIIILEDKNIELIKYLKIKKIKYYINLNNKKEKNLIRYLKIKRIKIDKKNKYKKYKKNKKNNCKIISVAGVNGVGKTIFTGIFSKLLKEKVLIIDLDKENNCIYTLFGLKKEKFKILKKNIIKINNKINLLINFNYKNNLEKILNKYAQQYSYIIIDIGYHIKNNNIKSILQNSDSIIFIIEGNLLQIEKSKKLLNFYFNIWNIKKEKINILLNKKNKNTISNKLIKNIFDDIKFLGEIKFNNNYDNLINNYLKNLMLYNKISKGYKKIIEKI